METLATFLASKFAEKPLFGESGEKFQEKQTEFASRIAENRQSGDLTFWTGSGTSYEAVPCPLKMANPLHNRLKADLFSPELVNARLTAKKQLSVETDSHVAFFQSKDLTTVEIIKETDVLLILMSKLTLKALLVWKSAINHVPPTYSMRCKDLHCVVIIYEMMATCASACCLTLSDAYFYVTFLERHCPKVISTSEFLPKDKLWKLRDDGRYCYTKFCHCLCNAV